MDGREFTLDNAESLLKGRGSGKINKREFKKKYSNIADDLEKMRNRPMPTRSQNKMGEILSLLKELVEEPPYEQPDTTDMPELESEESAEQRGQGLKILTPSQMLSRLPITLAQLKAGNNSEKLKNKIRQLLYSLYRSKKLTKTIYNNLINTI